MRVRVMVVDDQAPFRHAARAVIDLTDGFQIAAVVETGEAAVEKAREVRPDLILMDVNLPGIDGIEATRRILGDPNCGASVVVLLVSTRHATEFGSRVAESGAAAYIPKSEFSPDRLEGAWRDATKLIGLRGQ